MKKMMLLSLFAAGVLPLFAASGVPGVITADRLNLRLQPELKSPVAARLSKGEKVQVVGVKGNWLEVSAPESIKAYVSEAYISHGKTIASIKMHSDKSSTSPCLGVLPAGTVVKLVDDRGYGWVRIETPETIHLYTARMYVEFDAAQLAAQAAPAPKAAEAPAVVVEVQESAAQAADAKAAPAATTVVVEVKSPAASATPEASGMPVTKVPPVEQENSAAVVTIPAPKEDVK